MTIEIVDFPMKNGGSFHSYVNLPEGKPQKKMNDSNSSAPHDLIEHQRRSQAIDLQIFIQSMRPQRRQRSKENYFTSGLPDQMILIPRCSMYGIFTYIWVIIRANVGKYSIHGAYGQ